MQSIQDHVRSRRGCVRRLCLRRPGTNSVFPDRPSPVRPLLAATERASPDSKRGPPMPLIFGAAPGEYPREYGGGGASSKEP